MLTYEEAQVLRHLRRHATSRLGEPAETCLPGVSAGWLLRVLADPWKMGEAGLARAHREFSVAKMAERTAAVYESASAAS